jgi:hypothetical protein
MNRKQQYILYFNGLSLEERAEILGIDMSNYKGCEFNIVVVDLCEYDESEEEIVRMARIKSGLDPDLPLV